MKTDIDKIRVKARNLIKYKYPHLPLKEWGYFEDMFINGWNQAIGVQDIIKNKASVCKCGNELTNKEVFYGMCLKCGEIKID